SGDTFAPTIGLGSQTSYPLTITNDGNLPASDVRLEVSDATQLEVSLATAHGSCDASSCLLGTLAPGATVQVTASLSGTNSDFPSSVLALFKVQVTSSGPDSDGTNENLTVQTRAYGCPIGTEGPDVFPGTAGNDVFCGLGGDDHISGGAGND